MSLDDFDLGKISRNWSRLRRFSRHASGRVYLRIATWSPKLMSYQQQITLTTKGHGDMHDLTEQVAQADGRVRICCRH
jgi:hypothetical protein